MKFPKGKGKLLNLERVSVFGRLQKSGNGSYLIRWKLTKTDYGYSEGNENRYLTVQHQTVETWNIAKLKATQINTSLLIGTYDDSAWFPHKYQKTEVKKQLTLLDVWDSYKTNRKSIIAETTQNDIWRRIDKLINISTNLTIDESNLNNLISEWITKYNYNTLNRALSELNTALHQYTEYKNINLKEYIKQYNPKTPSKRSNKIYSEDEINIIIKTIKNYNEYYYRFILMMCLIGARPSELLNLTTSDISINYSVVNPSDDETGVLKIYASKTKRERYFPINKQLDTLLRDCYSSCEQLGVNNLLHNSKGNKINLHNFSNRIWKPQITQLVK